MTSKLTRPTFFHPAFVPHQHKYFTPQDIEAMAGADDYDQEKDSAMWAGLIAELKSLAALDDHASPAALDLGRRWLAYTEVCTKGDKILATKLRNLTKDAFADPVTAGRMPYTVDELIFLGMIFQSLKDLNEAKHGSSRDRPE